MFPEFIESIDHHDQSWRNPCCLCVANSAFSWKLQALMRRINYFIIIFDMATHTGIWCVVVISIVTNCTIHIMEYTRASDYIVLIVILNFWVPIRGCCMTTCTLHRKPRFRWVGIYGFTDWNHWCDNLNKLLGSLNPFKWHFYNQLANGLSQNKSSCIMIKTSCLSPVGWQTKHAWSWYQYPWTDWWFDYRSPGFIWQPVHLKLLEIWWIFMIIHALPSISHCFPL